MINGQKISAGHTQFHGMLPSAVEGHAIVHIEEADTVFLFGGYDGFGVTDKVIKYNLKTG